MSTFLTADPHFGHAKMITTGTRPFSSVEEMNQVLVRNWNAVVNEKDVVWVIGDFAFNMTEREIAEIFFSLNGRLRLVLGNHDYDNTGEVKAAVARLPWEKIVARAEIKHAGQRIILDHYAGLVWSADHHGSYLAYGHSHGRLLGLPGSIDVGVDNQGYRPISVDQFVKQADESIRNHKQVIHDVIRNLRGRSDFYAERALAVRELRPLKR
ncbi:metallophosphoesterase [Agrobacterium rubi]|nr:metallophosphoesterase [Agrobacterium rubi]NTF24064.1 metallophosphoesterase [Agrobacterium rubi]